MAPFILNVTDKNKQVIMVNRGWVPVGRDRNIIPELETPAGEISIRGVLAPPRSKPPLILGELDIENKVWPYFDGEQYARRIGRKVLPVIILLSENGPNGYVRKWPKYEAKVGMHIGYAIQWYVFALIVIATYFGLNIKQRDINDSRTDND
jgi:surfeit locus 1 family protein